MAQSTIDGSNGRAVALCPADPYILSLEFPSKFKALHREAFIHIYGCFKLEDGSSILKTKRNIYIDRFENLTMSSKIRKK